MFEKNDKRRLYQLMDMYLARTITASVFCDEFYYCYDLELDINVLTNFEKEAFKELSSVVDRFSEFEEDHLGLPHGFYTDVELRQKILETKENLKQRKQR